MTTRAGHPVELRVTEPAFDWSTIRSIAVTGAQIALKVLPLLLAAADEKGAAGARDDEPAVQTGPITWHVVPGARQVRAVNVDSRAWNITFATDGSSDATELSITVPPSSGPNDGPVIAADLWAALAEADTPVAIELAEPDPAQAHDLTGRWKLYTVIASGLSATASAWAFKDATGSVSGTLTFSSGRQMSLTCTVTPQAKEVTGIMRSGNNVTTVSWTGKSGPEDEGNAPAVLFVPPGLAVEENLGVLDEVVLTIMYPVGKTR